MEQCDSVSTLRLIVIVANGIRIGFELPDYTYMEPMFDETIDTFFVPESRLSVNGPIYLAKENNVTSEQTFLVVVQISHSVPQGQSIQPATLDVDYRVSAAQLGVTVVLQFGPRVQRINFPFTLFPDTLPERTEAFLASLAPADFTHLPDGRTFPVPTFLNPISLFAESFVIIEDDDREFLPTLNTV